MIGITFHNKCAETKRRLGRFNVALVLYVLLWLLIAATCCHLESSLALMGVPLLGWHLLGAAVLYPLGMLLYVRCRICDHPNQPSCDERNTQLVSTPETEEENKKL